MHLIKTSLVIIAVFLPAITQVHGQIDLTTLPGTAPILGINGGPNYNYSETGPAYTHNGNLGYIADGNPGTAEDTYGFFGNGIDSSYVGFTFTKSSNLVTSLTISFKMDGDGGWFGQNGQRPGGGPGDNSIPLAPYLIEPTLQYTLDGSTWINAPDSSNYLTVIGARTEGSNNAPNVTFTLDTPTGAIEGLRVIGLNGGIAGNGGGGALGGFIAVDEESITEVVPEPSTYAMLIAGLAFLAIGIRRQRNRA
jgi:hypothetical protein